MLSKNQIIFIIFFLWLVPGLAQTPELNWVNNYPADMPSGISSVKVSANDKSIYIYGAVNGELDLDPGPGEFIIKGQDKSTVFISKLDSAGNFQWAKSFYTVKTSSGGPGFNDLLSVDNDDNVYFAGFFDHKVDFDPSSVIVELTPKNSVDGFVCKLNTAGDFVWAKQFQCTGEVWPTSICVDGEQNSIIVGSFTKTIDLDPGLDTLELTNHINEDGFICKLNSKGEFVWGGQFETDMSVQHYYVTADYKDDVFITGGYDGLVDFDISTAIAERSPTNNYFVGITFICKMSKDGLFQWVKQLDGNQNRPTAISTDSEGNIYLGGQFSRGSIDADPGVGKFTLNSAHNEAGFLCKLRNNGDFVFAKCFTGNGAAWINSVSTDEEGNISYTGGFRQQIDLDPGNAKLNYDADYVSLFIGRLAISGELALTGVIANPSRVVYSNDSEIDDAGNFYCVGNYSGITDFDPTDKTSMIESGKQTSPYLLKLRPPSQLLNLRPDTTICFDDSLLILSGFPSHVSHSWSSGSNDTFIYAQAGSTSYLTIELGGIMYSDSVKVEGYKPTVYVGPDTAFCGEFEYRINAKGDDLVTYKWNNGDVLDYTIVNDHGMYYVQAKDRFDCPNADTMNLGELLAPTIELTPDTFLCDRTLLEINPAVNQLNVDFLWSTGSNNQSIIINDTGWYAVTVSIPFCETTDSVYVYSFCPPEPRILMPNAFSPNGDGLNDVFRPITEQVETYTMTIYNRWGEKLHSSSNGSWDGKYQGKLSQLGVYTYSISYTQKRTGITKFRSGVVHLMQ